MFKTVLFSASLFLLICEVTGVPKGYPCPTPKLKFGRTRHRQKGRFVKFMCNTGYIIAGEKYSTCVNHTWDSPMPKCVRASCVKVNPPTNGLIYPSHRGAVLNFFCKPGYDLRGPNATYCDGYTWDNKLPACIVSNTKPALSCDFESDDLCGWNHDIRHDFDWTRMNFKTPSGHLGTGPSYDHTKGDGGTGYYMYIESSSRNENDTARLISPIFDKMSDTEVCLEFFYHMHGASTGQLRVYLKKESDSWDLDPYKALFWKTGNHGDKWLRSLSHIGSIDEDFQIIIEGVRGASYFSDIAIDDVKIISNCTIEEDITTESDVTYTDDYQTMGSCLNRCDNDNLIIPPTTFQYSCDCDETCIDNNTCCPDYIVVCVLDPSDDLSTTEFPTTLLDYTTIYDETTTIETTIKSIKIYGNNTNTNEISTTLSPSKQNITKKYNPANATNFSKVPKPLNPPMLRPTLVFLTPSTTQTIIQKLRPKTTTKKISVTTGRRTSSTSVPTMTPQYMTTTKSPTTAIVSPLVPRQISESSSTQGPIDEILTVPEKPEEEDAPYFTSIPPVKMSESNANPVPVKKANDNMDILFSSSDTQNKKIVKEKSETGTTYVVVIVASVSLILLVTLSAVFAAKRYKFLSCRNRITYGSSSDSQSDVRFLTSDEILDFNLASPDD